MVSPLQAPPSAARSGEGAPASSLPKRTSMSWNPFRKKTASTRKTLSTAHWPARPVLELLEKRELLDATLPPVAVPDFYTVHANTTLRAGGSGGTAPGVLANDSGATFLNPLTAVKVSDTSNGELALNPDGSFTYTPTARFMGTDSFAYKANNGSADSNVVTVTIAVTDAAPVANADAYTVHAGQVLATGYGWGTGPGVLANDTDADGDSLTASKVTDPAHGSLAFNPDGSFACTPNSGYIGTDSFTYKANDGALDSNVATVTISVTNSPPVALADAYTVHAGQTLIAGSWWTGAPGVLANDTDADGDTLTATKVTDPAHGNLTLGKDGSFVYTPAAGFVGTDSFSYKANDGITDSNVADVTIRVT